MTQTEQEYIYAYVHMHVIAMDENEAMGLKESKERCTGGVGRRERDGKTM